MSVDLAAAREFMTAHARVLDRHRFDAVAFESDAARARTVAALDAYRNPDGGYGWGLEPDLRAPESQPVAALHAFEAFADAPHHHSGNAARLLSWLESVSHADGGLPFALAISNPAACAPFWAAADHTTSSLQITAAVAAHAHRAARADGTIRRHRWLRNATAYCCGRIEQLRSAPPAYELFFALQLLDALGTAEARALMPKLAPFVPADGVIPVEGGAVGETVALVPAPGSLTAELLGAQAISAHVDRIEQGQHSDGGWLVNFDSYSAAAALEWRGHATVAAITTLRAHGRLD